jgi:hypothetical protein
MLSANKAILCARVSTSIFVAADLQACKEAARCGHTIITEVEVHLPVRLASTHASGVPVVAVRG